jgi:hypothetical protein
MFRARSRGSCFVNWLQFAWDPAWVHPELSALYQYEQGLLLLCYTSKGGCSCVTQARAVAPVLHKQGLLLLCCTRDHNVHVDCTTHLCSKRVASCSDRRVQTIVTDVHSDVCHWHGACITSHVLRGLEMESRRRMQVVPSKQIVSAALCRALFEVWLGENAVVPDARTSFAAGVAQLVEADKVARAQWKPGGRGTQNP